MLNEFQTQQLWENLIFSQTRSLYFADLASTYTRRQQWMNGINFFLTAGAAATIVAGHARWAAAMAASSAALVAFTIALGTERKVVTMAKLHSEWHRIADKYERLWSHQSEDDAEQQLDRIIAEERAPSELASTEMRDDPTRLGKWQSQVMRKYGLAGQNG